MSVKTFKKRCCYCKTWQTRNNSSNVAAVLKPEIYTKEPDQHFLCHNTCYCREKRIRPQLFPRPRYCVEIDPDYLSDAENYLKGHSCTTNSTFLPSKETYLKEYDRKASNYRKNYIEALEKNDFPCDGTTDLGKVSSSSGQKYGSYFTNLPKNASKDNDYFKDTQGSKTKTVNTELSNGSYTDVSKRREYESHQSDKEFAENYETQKTNNESDINNVEDQYFFRKEPPIHFPTDTDGEESPNVLFPDTDYPKPTEGMKKASGTNLRQISDFRKDHYFETHSTEDLIKTIPEHICVHRFGLDNRFLPEPLHADGYGVSRCIICDKPMENPPVNKIDQRFQTKRENVFPKFYKYGLAPKRIYMGNDDNVKIEMKLSGDKMQQQMKNIVKVPNYVDTYALRYQKGVI